MNADKIVELLKDEHEKEDIMGDALYNYWQHSAYCEIEGCNLCELKMSRVNEASKNHTEAYLNTRKALKEL
jgi:hypothetical protein